MTKLMFLAKVQELIKEYEVGVGGFTAKPIVDVEFPNREKEHESYSVTQFDFEKNVIGN